MISYERALKPYAVYILVSGVVSFGFAVSYVKSGENVLFVFSVLSAILGIVIAVKGFLVGLRSSENRRGNGR